MLGKLQTYKLQLQRFMKKVTGQVRSDSLKGHSGQVRSDVRRGNKSGQVRSGQVRLGQISVVYFIQASMALNAENQGKFLFAVDPR